jgi:hypothetical protein
VQEHGARRTFVSTGAGFRVELHPPRGLDRRAPRRPPRADARRAPAEGGRPVRKGVGVRGAARPAAARLVRVRRGHAGEVRPGRAAGQAGALRGAVRLTDVSGLSGTGYSAPS